MYLTRNIKLDKHFNHLKYESDIYKYKTWEEKLF